MTSTVTPKKKTDLKVVILGDSAVGKSSLIKRYIEGTFMANSAHTIGASFFLKQWGPYNVAFWDTAGEERYSALSSFYCRGAGAAILAYDMTSSESFESLWARFLPLLECADENCLKVVVGTKRDLVTPANRQITAEEGQTFSETINETLLKKKLKTAPYFETSSCTGENVNATYEYVLKNCLPLEEGGDVAKRRSYNTVTLHDNEGTKKGSCC